MKIWFSIFAVYAIFGGAYFGSVGKEWAMGLSIVTGCLGMAFCNLDKLKSFQGAGFKAEMQKTIDEAQATIEQLREITLSLVEPIVTTVTMSGRTFQHLSNRYKLESIKKVEQQLENLGISSSEVRKVTSFYFDSLIQDHANNILRAYLRDESMDKDLKELVTKQINSGNCKNSQSAIKFIEDQGFERLGEVEELILDCRFFEKEREFKNPEIW